MASHKSPLRDRLLSNSPDPIKNSILRESGMGWGASTASSAAASTSPLRINKRGESPAPGGPILARRTSSSYRHMHTNNLVSKSPFKSQIPTPTASSSRPSSVVVFPTRRVSGDKRPRPNSLHELGETENDRPLAFKRERMQSNAYQVLQKKEPVTKSPFRRAGPLEETQPDPLPSLQPTRSLQRGSTPPKVLSPHRTNTQPISPYRSALVSRRMHGPRLSGGRRERRKTVTFHERCDVLEYDRESEEGESFRSAASHSDADSSAVDLVEEWVDQPMDTEADADEGRDAVSDVDASVADEPSYESIHLSDSNINPPGPTLLTDPDASITGIVDEMFSAVNASGANFTDTSVASHVSTPPRHGDLPTDLEVEDGVPFGRSHHIERFLQAQQTHSPRDRSPIHFSPDASSPARHASPRAASPFGGIGLGPRASPLGAPSTPPRRSPAMRHSTPPLGRSTHAERVSQAREEEKEEATDADVEKLPISPSPVKKPTPNNSLRDDSLVPKFDLSTSLKPSEVENNSSSCNLEPFDQSRLQDQSALSEMETDEVFHSLHPSPFPASAPRTPASHRSSPITPSRIAQPTKAAPSPSPVPKPASPHLAVTVPSSLNKSPSRERITRESIQKRLDRMVGRTPSPVPPPAVATPPQPSLARSSPSPAAGLRTSHVSPAPESHESDHEDSEEGEQDQNDDDAVMTSADRPLPHPPVTEVDDAPPPHAVSSSPIPSSSNPPANVFARQNLAPFDPEKDRDRMSVLTTQTDFSVESAVVERAEKRHLGLSTAVPMSVPLQPMEEAEEEDRNDFGLKVESGSDGRLQFDFGSKFSLGGFKLPDFEGEEFQESVKRDVASSPPVQRTQQQRPVHQRHHSQPTEVRMGDREVDMDMKSALDRLLEDVEAEAGAGIPAASTPRDRERERSLVEGFSSSFDQSMDATTTDGDGDSSMDDDDVPGPRRRLGIERAATDSVLLDMNMQANGITSRTVSNASTITIPPPVPPKDGGAVNKIQSREQLILQKRREARGLDGDGDATMEPGARQNEMKQLGVGRPSRRRSLSTGDVDRLASGSGGAAQQRQKGGLLGIVDEKEADLVDSIQKELQKLTQPESKAKYQVRERTTTIIASSSDDKISHTTDAGDVDAGRAWRAVRRPSDMNEYAKQIKEYRAQEKGKAYGKVFVKVLGIKNMNLPLPAEPTVASCTLNNGIHFVTTPEFPLGQQCRVEQEFELIEHSKLEFTLTLKIRRDPHIVAQFKAVAAPPPVSAAPPPPPPVVQATTKSSAMRNFFSSSPRKAARDRTPQPQPIPYSAPYNPLQPAHRLPENLARHLKPDGTLARAFVSFKEVAAKCDSRLFETSFPLIGQRVEAGGKYSTLEVGEIVLQMFRLPPLPGLKQDQLPQSLEECIRGLRHINWHKVTYFQGTLTQLGGDCSTWRRRQLRVIGCNLVAFNDVTKRATATIDLKKAIAVEDDQANGASQDDDLLYGVERSFRLIFPRQQEIIFFADTDDEKAKWLEVFKALVGHIPPHPLWGELLWQRQEEIAKRMAAAQHSLPSPTTTTTAANNALPHTARRA